MFFLTTTKLCIHHVKHQSQCVEPTGVDCSNMIYLQKQAAGQMGQMDCSLPRLDLINCSASYSTGIHPNSFPWPRRPCSLIWLPFALSMFHYDPATLTSMELKLCAKSIPISGPLHLLFSLLESLFPRSPLSCLSSSPQRGPHWLPQWVSTYQGMNILSPMVIDLLQITYHLKTIISCMCIICLPNHCISSLRADTV